MSRDMEIAEILRLASAFIAALDIVNLRGERGARFLDNRLPMVAVACTAIILSYLYLAWAFATNSFRFDEVYQYSSSGLSLAERLYASWASSGGSWLFFGFLYVVTFLLIRLKVGQDKKASKIYLLQDIIFLFIIIIVIIQ